MESISDSKMEVAYSLAMKQCTLEAIQNLLRQYKPVFKKEIRVTAENKSDVINRNLRVAVDKRLIPANRVFDLIRDSEENGSQHIFFYRAKNPQTVRRYADAVKVASSLWGDSWEKAEQFPRLLDGIPEKAHWCDFRAIPDMGWIAKMYGVGTRYEAVGQEQEVGVDPDDGATIYERRYKRVVERTVLLMRWTNRNLLEVRVPTWSSRKSVEQMRELIWKSAAGAVKVEDFVPWSLTSCCTKMIRDFAKYKGIYDFSDSLIRDSRNGTAAFSTVDEEETLFDAVERQRALEAMLQPKNNACERIVVTFLKQKPSDVIQEDLRVVIGAYDPNEVVIGSKTTPAVADYVIHRLHEFA